MYKDKISLVLWDINQSSLEDTVQILLENGTLRVFPYCVDISKPEQVVATAKMVINVEQNGQKSYNCRE